MGIVCEAFPYWGWVAGAGGAEVAWVVRKSKGSEAAAFGGLEMDRVSWWREPEDLDEWLKRQEAVEVVCFDSVKPGSLRAVWGLPKLEVVIWFGPYSRARLPVGWTSTSFLVNHAELGGVTSGTFNVHVGRRAATPVIALPPEVGVRMYLDSVIDRTGRGHACAPPSGDWKILVGTKGLDEQYVVPSVFSSTSFVRRKLTTQEAGLVWDLPAGIMKACDAALQEELVRGIRLPFKVRVHALQVLREPCSDPEVDPLVWKPSPAPTHALEEKQDTQAVTPVDRDAKATKADDAAVPKFLWNDRLGLPMEDGSGSTRHVEDVLEKFRRLLHRRWVSNLARSFWRWVVLEKTKRRALAARVYTAGLAVKGHALESDWWEWTGGSAVFFWRWPEAFQTTIREGLAPRFDGPPPVNRKPQYIAPGLVRSLINMFPVPKGDSDVHLVFDATASGLNEVLFSPWFKLPTVMQMVRTVDIGYFCADNDFGEMFYNFWLHEDLRPFTGIDLTRLCPKSEAKAGATVWEQFTRPTMGLGPSPYQAVQGALQFKSMVLERGTAEVAKPTNVFHWVKVELNVPGMRHYTPGKPWIFKLRIDGRIAVDLHLFVDDGRVTGPTQELAWEGGSRIAKLAAWYGLQDAARKRRPPSQTPGAWSGSVVSTTTEGVYLSVSKERWSKTKESVEWIARELREGSGTIEFKPLERIRGFLVYVGQTYQAMVPYLKGIHLTLDSWRGGRDTEGWRLSRGAMREEGQPRAAEEVQAPDRVKVVPRLNFDVDALMLLMDHEDPPKVQARPTASARVVIGFGDASGNGFGISEADNQGDYQAVEYVYGVWKEEVSAQSSNFRELNNFVVRIESGLKSGSIQAGTEFFLFTDNFVTERAFYKGTSKA